jgi:hypothetical protein
MNKRLKVGWDYESLHTISQESRSSFFSDMSTLFTQTTLW